MLGRIWEKLGEREDCDQNTLDEILKELIKTLNNFQLQGSHETVGFIKLEPNWMLQPSNV